jgi:hypothetical protein
MLRCFCTSKASKDPPRGGRGNAPTSLNVDNLPPPLSASPTSPPQGGRTENRGATSPQSKIHLVARCHRAFPLSPLEGEMPRRGRGGAPQARCARKKSKYFVNLTSPPPNPVSTLLPSRVRLPWQACQRGGTGALVRKTTHSPDQGARMTECPLREGRRACAAHKPG